MNANLLGAVWYLCFIATILLIFLIVPLARRIRQRIREHDERALHNRQRRAIRDREDREVDRRADFQAEWHRRLRADRSDGALKAVSDLNNLKSAQAQRTIYRMEATPTAAQLLAELLRSRRRRA